MQAAFGLSHAARGVLDWGGWPHEPRCARPFSGASNAPGAVLSAAATAA